MNTTLSRMGRVYRVLRKTHGRRIAPLLVAMGFGALRVVVGICMAIDNVFGEFRRTRVRAPIVLVGNPRTGTTFLQRFLADEGFGCGMELYSMLYPSLLLQKLIRPLLPLLEKVSPAKYHSTAAHETSLSSVETDDVGVFFRYLDGFFLYGFFLSFDEQDMLPSVDPKQRDTADRDFAWLEALWRRSLVAHGATRNVAKLFSLAPRLPAFLKQFPDAKVLYMVRDPVSVIPSAMSLVTGVLDRAFGFWSLPDEVRRIWLYRMYEAWVMLFRRFHDDWTSGAIDRERVFVVRYDRMMQDFEGFMVDLCRFLDHEITPELRSTIRSRAEKQRSYQSDHAYDLERFGLSEERIRRDCDFVYATFLPPMAGLESNAC
jgi:hypothetical protein